MGSEQEQHPAVCHRAGVVPRPLVTVCFRPIVGWLPGGADGATPRWPGVIRDPRPTSSLGGAPGGFWLLCQPCCPHLSGGWGWCLLGKGGGHFSSPARQGHSQDLCSFTAFPSQLCGARGGFNPRKVQLRESAGLGPGWRGPADPGLGQSTVSNWIISFAF